MTEQIDNWHKLARYNTNIQGELHATLLRNNGIEVSLQMLSAIPGLNSGIVLWVQEVDFDEAKAILDSIDTNHNDDDMSVDIDEMNDDGDNMNVNINDDSTIVNNQGGNE